MANMDITEALLVLTGIKSVGVVQDPNKETFTDGYGNHIANVHRKDQCTGKCAIHNHSQHPLSIQPLLWRNDRKIFEHLCIHGIGHPCPDSLPDSDSDVHGCCGICCREEN